MLLLLLLLQHASAGGTETTPIINNITSCPGVGYFIRRDVVLNAIDPGPCLLCFCRENTSAVCWKRDSSRCDQKNYRHYGKRDARFRRSPSFTDIFFRDAARDVLDKRTPEQCKPYESSFSEGCPPADWCIGCTVCDCDANGRWDCHILSFCPDKKGKKQVQKKKSSFRNNTVKRNDSVKKAKKQPTTKKIPSSKAVRTVRTPKPPKKATKTATVKKDTVKRSSNKKKEKVKIIHAKKISQINKNTSKIQKTATTRAVNTKFIKKKPSTAQQATRKSYKTALQNVKEKNDTYKLAEAIVKRVMSNVEKFLNENQKMNKPKVIQKRSMPKHYNTTNKKTNYVNSKKNKTVKKLKKRSWDNTVSLKQQTDVTKHSNRAKRSIGGLEINNSTSCIIDTTPVNIIWENETEVQLSPHASTTPARSIDYFKYDVQTENVTKPSNINTIEMYNESNKEVSISLHSSVVNETTENRGTLSSMNATHYKFMNRIMEMKSKDFITRKRYNDKWKDQDGLLAKKYTKRMYQKLKGSNIKYNNNMIDNIHNNKSCGNVCSFKTIFKKIFFGIEPSSTERNKANIRKINVLTSIKNLFKPLFAKKKTISKKFVQIKKHRNILNAICKKFNLCHPNLNNKMLRLKLTDLNREAYKILKIVSSIKGLLHLLNNTEHVAKNNLTNDIEKLDVILREYYTMDGIQSNITETQRIQIKYIRENTQAFVKTIEQFALTLNDIIHMIKKQNKTKFSTETPRSYLRCARKSRNENKSIDDRITRLKKLLLSYNLVQNKFMLKMYDALTSLQKDSDKTSLKVSEKRPFLNNSIETYSRNIIENLRKLKALGLKLNSKGRAKREAMGDEDAIDYLLVLMEYLLKQNKPVTYPPVNDGIDLLIDAIKHAPDITPLNMNMVKFTPKTIPPTRTTQSSENMSYNKAGKRIRNEKEYLYKKIDSFDDTIYSNNDKNKNNLKLLEKYATPIYDKKLNQYTVGNKTTNRIEEVTEPVPVYINKQDPDTYDKGDNLEEKILKNKFEVYNADGDDEDDSIDIFTRKGSSSNEVPLKAEIDIEKEHEKLLNHVHHDVITPNNDIDEKKDKEKISKLNWRDDISDLDMKSAGDTTMKTIVTHTTAKPQVATRTVRRHKDKYARPISVSSEETEVYSGRRKGNTNSRLNKIDIFNSFDYNTEKSEVDSDSKEDKNDAFSDFV